MVCRAAKVQLENRLANGEIANHFLLKVLPNRVHLDRCRLKILIINEKNYFIVYRVLPDPWKNITAPECLLLVCFMRFNGVNFVAIFDIF